jgi:hypothetical protein
MTAEPVTALCMHCGARPARIVVTGDGDWAACAALCGSCAIEDKAARVVMGAPVPIYSRFVQPAEQHLLEEAAQAMRRWVAADRAVLATFMEADVLICQLNRPPWSGHAAA